MKLIVKELIDKIDQKVSCIRNANVQHIRAHLYLKNSPTGTIKIQILDVNKQLIAESNLVNIADISDAPYYHGLVRFDVKAQLRLDTPYYFRLKTDSYAFSEASYVGWCADYDFKTYKRNTNKALFAPMDYEVWVLK